MSLFCKAKTLRKPEVFWRATEPLGSESKPRENGFLPSAKRKALKVLAGSFIL
jgi:hypothetical protein